MITKEEALVYLESMYDWTEGDVSFEFNTLKEFIEQQESRLAKIEESIRILPELKISDQPEWNMSESNPEV